MKEDPEDQPYFHISIVSEMLNLHPQTIRNYERMGLIRPARTEGRMRLFSQKDVNRVKQIHEYTSLGVNLAGVEIIMKLKQRIDELEKQIFKYMKQNQTEIMNKEDKDMEVPNGMNEKKDNIKEDKENGT